jgi:phosphate-selective porin
MAGICMLFVGEQASGFVPISPTMRLEETDQVDTPVIGDVSGEIDGDGPTVIRSSDPVPVPEVTAPPAPETDSSWRFRWMGWDGVEFEIQEKTSFKNPAVFTEGNGSQDFSYMASHFSVERLTFHARIGIRADMDFFHSFPIGSTGNKSTRLALRRFRVLTKGDFQLLFPVIYQLELGYVPNNFYVENMYIAMEGLKWLGELKLGQFTAPMGLDALTSSRWITFMEEASPSAALAPGVNLGLQMHRTFKDDKITFTGGLFSDAVTSDTGEATENFGRLIGRLSWVSGWEDGPAIDEPEQMVHWGVSMNAVYAASDFIQYRSRPEAHAADYLIDTGPVDADKAETFAVEFAKVSGPRLLQWEAFLSRVSTAGEADDSSLLFFGGYFTASWILTGERRRYIKKGGVFGGVRPNTTSSWDNKWGGALEVSGRISYTDLTDGSIDGGSMLLAGAGLTWYARSRLRFKANLIGGQVKRFGNRDNVLLIEFRVSTDLGP